MNECVIGVRAACGMRQVCARERQGVRQERERERETMDRDRDRDGDGETRV